jgi:hypothetical protein
MRRGGGKSKGAAAERKLCVLLSLWVSGGTKQDLFWRAAMSGGRATIHKRAGRDVRQAGDVCSVAPEGHVLTNKFFIENKHVKKLDIASFLLDGDKGILTKFWKVACKQARDHMRQPLLIAQENHRKPLVICRHRGLRMFCLEPPRVTTSSVEVRYLEDVLKTKFPY